MVTDEYVVPWSSSEALDIFEVHSIGLDITDAPDWMGWFPMLHSSDAELALIPAGLLTGTSSFPGTPGTTPLPV